jgi:hypothetical protein
MKKFLLFLPLFLTTLGCFAGGLSAWQEETPYGHTIYHDGSAGGWVCLSIVTNSICFQHFYFYKGHTVAYSDSSYFIINERKETVQKFTNEQQWLEAIQQQNLKPIFKREYNSDYSSIFGDDIFFFLVFLPVPLLMPILWLCCLISLAFPWQWAKGFRKYYAWIYPSIVLILIMYSIFPQSL